MVYVMEISVPWEILYIHTLVVIVNHRKKTLTVSTELCQIDFLLLNGFWNGKLDQ